MAGPATYPTYPQQLRIFIHKKMESWSFIGTKSEHLYAPEIIKRCKTARLNILPLDNQTEGGDLWLVPVPHSAGGCSLGAGGLHCGHGGVPRLRLLHQRGPGGWHGVLWRECDIVIIVTMSCDLSVTCYRDMCALWCLRSWNGLLSLWITALLGSVDFSLMFACKLNMNVFNLWK